MVLSFPVLSFGNRNILYQEVVPISMIYTFFDKNKQYGLEKWIIFSNVSITSFNYPFEDVYETYKIIFSLLELCHFLNIYAFTDAFWRLHASRGPVSAAC